MDEELEMEVGLECQAKYGPVTGQVEHGTDHPPAILTQCSRLDLLAYQITLEHRTQAYAFHLVTHFPQLPPAFHASMCKK